MINGHRKPLKIRLPQSHSFALVISSCLSCCQGMMCSVLLLSKARPVKNVAYPVHFVVLFCFSRSRASVALFRLPAQAEVELRLHCFVFPPKMSRKFDMIESINDSKETFKLAVRIVDLWYVQINNKSRHMEMILMDGKKHKIHAVVKKDELQTWETELKENKTYYMYNFRVLPNDGQYKVCQHPFKLFFTGGTTLKQVDLPDIPFNPYDFKSFEDIMNGDYDPKMLIDMIGMVEEVKFQLPSGNPPKVVFTIKDLSGQLITCTLWSDHATKFISHLKEQIDVHSIVIVLTQARIKPPQGIHALSISNSLYGSKLLIDNEVPDLGIYKERLATAFVGQASSVTQSLSVGQESGGSQFSDVDRFLYKSKLLTISEITDIPDGTNFCTVGTTTKLIAGKGGWFYYSCARCSRKAEHENTSFTCSCGKFNEKSVPRYRLEIMVSNKKDSTNLIFWDRDCTDFIGMSAVDLRELMIQAGEDDPKHFPNHLDKMLGLKLALKCKYQAKFNSSSVLKVSNDTTMLDEIVHRMNSEKDSENQTSKPTGDSSAVVDKALSQMQHVLQQDSQPLSGTADHDPEKNATLTPSKRTSLDLSADQTSSEGISASQLSATKLSKTKTE